MEVLAMNEIVGRLVLALAIGGVVGYERERKNRPAGMRTHMLVCLSACIIALIQQSISLQAVSLVRQYKELVGVVKFDQARLIAPAVSGIGFLGAGTIIMAKQRVFGLTTAASLWASTALGIGIGMGYYRVAILGFLAIMLSLTIVKKVIQVPKLRNLEIEYIHRLETKVYIANYFEKQGIAVEDVTFELRIEDGLKLYRNTYTIDLPKALTYADVIEELSMYPNIQQIRLVTVNE